MRDKPSHLWLFPYSVVLHTGYLLSRTRFIVCRMSTFPSSKAKQVLAALIKIGCSVKRQTGSHKALQREGYGISFMAKNRFPPHHLPRRFRLG
jgi:predicted RNA binding protein YcfA (HicA-like mRNA interferase family)